MPVYRRYRIGKDHHLVGPSTLISCDTEDEAVAKARELCDPSIPSCGTANGGLPASKGDPAPRPPQQSPVVCSMVRAKSSCMNGFRIIGNPWPSASRPDNTITPRFFLARFAFSASS